MTDEFTPQSEVLSQDIINHELFDNTERGINWEVKNSDSIWPGHTHNKVVTLTDGATVAIDTNLGNTFYLEAAGDRTISPPTGAKDGKKIIIAHYANGANRTLALTTGETGGFRFGTTVSALSATASGKVDYIGCIYNAVAQRWDVVSVSKGY